MPLPSFDKKDDIPEAFRSDYIERNGKYVYNDAEAEGLKANQKTLLDEKKKAEKEAARLRSLHGDLPDDEVAELIKGRRTAEEQAALKAGDFEKLMAKREKEIRNEYEPKVKAGEEAAQKLVDRDLTAAIMEAAGKAKVIGTDLKTVIRIVKNDRVKMENGKVTVYDADGDPTGLTVEKFFAETFKTEYPKFYEGAGASGGGAGATSTGGARTDGTIARDDDKAFLANLDKVAKGEVKVSA